MCPEIAVGVEASQDASRESLSDLEPSVAKTWPARLDARRTRADIALTLSIGQRTAVEIETINQSHNPHSRPGAPLQIIGVNIRRDVERNLI